MPSEPFKSYTQNQSGIDKVNKDNVDQSSRERRAKAADVTLEYLKLLQGNNQTLPPFEDFLNMQEQQKRQLRPHGALESDAPSHVERDQQPPADPVVGA